jgi:AraC-like DNA-binding protein
LAKVAVQLRHDLTVRERGGPAQLTTRRVAGGDGWSVLDARCTAGPRDRPFEEQHACYSISIVTGGTFQYRSAVGRDVMTPGSLLLGTAGQYFECGHEHACGDRCLSFGYSPAFFNRIAADAGCSDSSFQFRLQRVPPLRDLSPIIARACAGEAAGLDPSWEELSLQLAARTIQIVAGLSAEATPAPPHADARITHIVRVIEQDLSGDHTLGTLAGRAELSPFHFLRTFERVTGVTPHQYVLRARLREAARRLLTERARIVDVALDAGFGDISNFNHAFRTEFGVAPRRYRLSR